MNRTIHATAVSIGGAGVLLLGEPGCGKSDLALDLAEAAVKIRSGDPVDEPTDVDTGGRWAGVLPVEQSWGEPVPAADLDGTNLPPHVAQRAFTTIGRADPTG